MTTEKRTFGRRAADKVPGASEVADPERPVLNVEEPDAIQRDYRERTREKRSQEIREQLRELRQRMEGPGRVR